MIEKKKKNRLNLSFVKAEEHSSVVEHSSVGQSQILPEERLAEHSLIGQSQILLEEKPLLIGLIYCDDQLCCTQASQCECVAGEGYPPVDVSSFCLVRLSSILWSTFLVFIRLSSRVWAFGATTLLFCFFKCVS